MADTGVTAFEDNLTTVGGRVITTPASEVQSVLEAECSTPAIGIEPALEGVRLPPVVKKAPTGADLQTAVTGITPVSLGIADYGSVVIAGRPDGAEIMSLYVEDHVAILAESDLLTTMSEATEAIEEMVHTDGTDAVIATGPSATADMGELVTGVHGPATATVVVVEDR